MEVRRRRTRTFAPEMLTAVRELLATGASAREVAESIARRQANDDLDGMAAPSVSTIKAIARETPRDEDNWTLEDSGPVEGGLALRVLSAVQRKSHGRVRHLSKREARIAAVILSLHEQESEELAWKAYVRAREYIAALHRGDDPTSISLSLFDTTELDAATTAKE